MGDFGAKENWREKRVGHVEGPSWCRVMGWYQERAGEPGHGCTLIQQEGRR